MGNVAVCGQHVSQVAPLSRTKSLAELSITDFTDSPRTARRISKLIDSFIEKERRVVDNVVKLLLLGK